MHSGTHCRKLVIAAKRQRFESVPRLTVSWVAAAGTSCSVHTAYRRLPRLGLNSVAPLFAFLSPLSTSDEEQIGAENMLTGPTMNGSRYFGPVNLDLASISMVVDCFR